MQARPRAAPHSSPSPTLLSLARYLALSHPKYQEIALGNEINLVGHLFEQSGVILAR